MRDRKIKLYLIFVYINFQEDRGGYDRTVKRSRERK